MQKDGCDVRELCATCTTTHRTIDRLNEWWMNRYEMPTAADVLNYAQGIAQHALELEFEKAQSQRVLYGKNVWLATSAT